MDGCCRSAQLGRLWPFAGHGPGSPGRHQASSDDASAQPDDADGINKQLSRRQARSMRPMTLLLSALAAPHQLETRPRAPWARVDVELRSRATLSPPKSHSSSTTGRKMDTDAAGQRRMPACACDEWMVGWTCRASCASACASASVPSLGDAHQASPVSVPGER